MAETDAINCVSDLGFPSLLVCSKGLFALKPFRHLHPCREIHYYH